jgi:protease-4
VGLVRERRGIDTKSVAGLEQGRVFSGRDALANKLIDEIGGEEEARKYLEEQRNIPQGLKIVDWKASRDSDWSLVRLSMLAVARMTGLSALEEVAMLSNDRLAAMRLDGLLSIWHGSER